MPQSKNKFLLVTTNLAVQQKIKSFCDTTQDNTCEIIIKNDLSNNGDCSVILIGQDKIHLIPANPHQLNAAPLIYLHEKSDNGDINTFIKTQVDEIIDMTKITAVGFFRAIHNTMEKFYINSELNKQKYILKQLIASSQNASEKNTKNKDKSSEADSSIKDLIEENKRLIDVIQTQNEELKKFARIDMLTKVGNRLSFDETFTRMIEHATRHHHLIAMLMIDLDKFKNVNDSHGHQVGDLLLQMVAQRFSNVLRKGDFIARMGGDEFAIILNEIKSPHAAGLVSWKISQEINKPFVINNLELRIKASIGIACFPLAGDNLQDLVTNADIAMYEAKKSHTSKYIFANIETQNDHIKKIKMENELKMAIDHDELHMVYQPIYEIPSKKLHGFEALIRWKNKSLGQISPGEFIPIAEDSGLIHPISNWVFETVFKQISEWKNATHFPYKISINLSPSQLIKANLLEVINTVTKKYNVPLNLIEFEITEMAAMQENEAVNTAIRGLCELGASHALDDFGTGYSSMKHLRLLPISTIKIDLSFVQGLGIHKEDNDIVSSIIALAKKLGLKVVAEGVETQQQLDALTAENCDYIQGYYFSKPITAADALQLIKEEG